MLILRVNAVVVCCDVPHNRGVLSALQFIPHWSYGILPRHC